MNKIIHVLTAIIALAITSCTKSDSQYSRDLGTAEYLMQSGYGQCVINIRDN